jgi:predicted RNA-binding protein with PUA-like domain
MAYWLLKSEPSKYSWQQMARDERTAWDGVRNHQAAANLRAMAMGDRAFFYHSNEGLAIMGIVEVARTYYPDPGDVDGRFGMVDVRAVRALPRPVTLAAIKAEPRLGNLALVRQSRLSVMPVDAASWKLLCRMGGLPR